MEQTKKPFITTHLRKDGLPAMLLAVYNGQALYRVRWQDKGRSFENTLNRPEAVFLSLFKAI